MAGMFGTDGVRARINTGAMTAEAIVRLALASGRWFIDNYPEDRSGRPLVVIGTDTRVSGYMVEAALVAGFTSIGMDCRLLGPMPTGGLLGAHSGECAVGSGEHDAAEAEEAAEAEAGASGEAVEPMEAGVRTWATAAALKAETLACGSEDRGGVAGAGEPEGARQEHARGEASMPDAGVGASGGEEAQAARHVHVFPAEAEERYDEASDRWIRRCTGCGFELRYERMG